MSTVEIISGVKKITETTVGPKVGLDTNVVGGTITGSFTPEGLSIGGLITTMAIDDTKWWVAPATPLANRENVVIQNQSTNGGVMLWNYNPAAGPTDGLQVLPGGSRSVAVKPAILIYVRMVSGTGIACVEELA